MRGAGAPGASLADRRWQHSTASLSQRPTESRTCEASRSRAPPPCLPPSHPHWERWYHPASLLTLPPPSTHLPPPPHPLTRPVTRKAHPYVLHTAGRGLPTAARARAPAHYPSTMPSAPRAPRLRVCTAALLRMRAGRRAVGGPRVLGAWPRQVTPPLGWGRVPADVGGGGAVLALARAAARAAQGASASCWRGGAPQPPATPPGHFQGPGMGGASPPFPDPGSAMSPLRNTCSSVHLHNYCVHAVSRCDDGICRSSGWKTRTTLVHDCGPRPSQIAWHAVARSGGAACCGSADPAARAALCIHFLTL